LKPLFEINFLMPIITLTTDWGHKDHYLAGVKGCLLKAIPDANIIDISHDIPPFDVYQASFILKSSYRNFPANTIHILGVNSESSIETPHIVLRYDNQYFIGADNGIFSLMFVENPSKIIELNIIQDSDKFTFSTKDVFVKVAQHITDGKNIEELGFIKKSLNKLMSFEPVIENNENGGLTIIGKVIYIDRYENAIVNISRELFEKTGKRKNFSISFNSFSNIVTKISKSYGDVSISDMVAIFDSNDYLELSINQGNAGSLMGLKIDTKVRVTFDS